MNNKKNNRKGFTIVELVIVIAVIAILASVLVPTFGSIIQKANASKLLQELKNEYINYVAEVADEDGFDGSAYILYNGNYYQFNTNGQLEVDENDAPKVVTISDGVRYWDADSDTINVYTDATDEDN